MIQKSRTSYNRRKKTNDLTRKLYKWLDRLNFGFLSSMFFSWTYESTKIVYRLTRQSTSGWENFAGHSGLKRTCCDDVIYTDYRVPRTVTRVANRPVFPGTSRISGPVSLVPAWVFPGRKMSRIFVKPSSKFLDVMRHQLIHIKFHPETLKLMCVGREH